MEFPGVGNPASTNDDVAGGRQASTARVQAEAGAGAEAKAGTSAGGGNRGTSSRSSSTSGVRRIVVAPAAVASDCELALEQPASQEDAIHCSWKPMKPGYAATSSSSAAGDALLIERTVKLIERTSSSSSTAS